MLHKKYGFTLIELLTVVLIVAAMAAIALPQYRRSVMRAQAVEGMTHLKAILDASMNYYASFGTKPTSLKGLNVSFQSADSNTSQTPTIDNFKFDFGGADSSTITASFISNGSSDNTYTLTGYYNNPTYGGRGAMTCTSNNTKYNSVCIGLGVPTSAANVYVIK